MKIDKLRHDLLVLLSAKSLASINEGNKDIFVERSRIIEFLGNDGKRWPLILSELLEADEIKVYNTNGQNGFFSTDLGNMAYSNKKYLLRHQNLMINRAKNFMQIAIPLLSFMITVCIGNV
ncbi:hypothetical protein ASE92_08590 [Pedobacter sp. Leaf41]|uniref:hypothetical protein n=1 Tax=Pedobacter sp. Leaf41 TaxID=1736218 RepID=UPI000703998E|nr:hypothetical protein [Pedobacter sp. Leaf41]KQN36175.1 hypothetical protein ASE92_08590 [Pedobacter sp. Leaf41]